MFCSVFGRKALVFCEIFVGSCSVFVFFCVYFFDRVRRVEPRIYTNQHEFSFLRDYWIYPSMNSGQAGINIATDFTDYTD